MLVDGAEMQHCLSGVDVEMHVGEPNLVRLHMVSRVEDIDIQAVVRIGGTSLPEAVERALLLHLSAKYPPGPGEPGLLDVTSLASTEREFVKA
ncbi:hypothetical protein ACEN9J_03045 [Variovorax sp. Varisp41]|uniref:hypothetical protein n=1 Tax=Variovorax sp. Varisp41 TaxID=3243033 RepID=UPI0039B6DF07